ncbi:MAG: prepilin peptidase [Pseudomonadales bacterium]|nr:prepilin peptidase [Pseudomonadales bacterium]
MSSYLSLLQGEYPVVIIALTLMFGLIIGSFLNVVIFRLPVIIENDWKSQANELLGLKTTPPSETFNLIFPGSRCPGCNHKIKPWENIPVLSYLYLRGKCAECGMSISARYPAIELLTGLLTCVVVYHFGLTWAAVAACVLTWSLIPLAMIDYDHQLLPDGITLPLMWVGLLVNYFDVIVNFRDAFLGAIAGYLVLWIVFHVFRLVTGKEGMGYGDFKLLAMLGAWMGWQALPVIIILSSFTGALLGGLLIALGRDRANPIPFGPFLAIAGWITLLWGNEITSTWLRFAA